MRIAILSPINNSLYSRVLTWACIQEPGIDVVQVVVRRTLSWKRIIGEIKRDGPRLLKKVHQKLVLGEQTVQSGDPQSLFETAKTEKLPGLNLTDLCRENNIPVLMVGDHNDTWAVEAIVEAKLDAILFTGGGLIRKDLLNASRLGVINCHAGYLPEYRGMDVVEWPLLNSNNGIDNIGLTLHFMDRGVDTGQILIKKPIEIDQGDTFENIRMHMGPQMVALMMEGLRGLRDGKLNKHPQKKEDGRQYFVMHPRVKEAAEKKLAG